MIKSKKHEKSSFEKNNDPQSLGDSLPSPQTFPQIEQIINSYKEKSFLNLPLRKKFKIINQTLCQLILEAHTPSFLLGPVIDYLDKVNKEKLFNEPFNFAAFEFWLNHFSNLSEQDNYLIRAKITGKYIPRSEYQSFFPIGMNRTFKGTHFVAAHLSPDVDTTVASFWGWVDAFAARVGTGLHLWALPGGPPDSAVMTVLRGMVSESLFSCLARTSMTLTLSAMDLVSQQKLIKVLGNTLTSELDYGSNDKVYILVNEQEQYLSDCRIADIELARQIVISFKSCLRWYEKNLHTKLISLLAKKDLTIRHLPAFNSSVFDVKIKDCEPALEFSLKQQNDLHCFLQKVLGIKNGLEASFGEMNLSLEKLGVSSLALFQKELEALPKSDIFDSKGHLLEDRPTIFHRLDKIIHQLDEAIHHVRSYSERLDVVLGIKQHVLKLPSEYLTLRSDVEEMKQKMQNLDFMTVVIHEQDGSLFPVGIVGEADLQKSSLGTVSFRDFCNQDEVRMASYLEVISVIDHHKSHLKTATVPSALIGDAQSCNVLLAELAFAINDRFSLGGMTIEEIEKQIHEKNQESSSRVQTRLLQRLLQRRMVTKNENSFFIHPNREYSEYLSFLHAILDDTDLLTKVSNRDIYCVGQILNRLKSLHMRREVEAIDFDDIKNDKNFAKLAAQKLLKHPDMYTLYKKVYDYRENEVTANLQLCVEGQRSNIFADTKEQNNCARVGQTKLFVSNFPIYLKNAHAIRQEWLKQAQEANQETPDIDLHIHMISTIASADEVYQNEIGPYMHKDELWFWTSKNHQGCNHLIAFLNHFQNLVKGQKEEMDVEFFGSNSEIYKEIFQQNFVSIPFKESPKEKISLAVLRVKAGTVNSRKSMITPCLPKLIS